MINLNHYSQMVTEILSTFSPIQHKSTGILHKQFKIKVYNGNVNKSLTTTLLLMGSTILQPAELMYTSDRHTA